MSPPHIEVLHLFPEERDSLLAILRGLTTEQWLLPTVCEGWSVKDIAQHILADDLGRLSREQDGWHGTFEPTGTDTFEAELLAYINQVNEQWVEATRRLGPGVVIGLLEWSGRETQVHFESLDLDAMGMGVSWAGEDSSAVWFDLAREYTERWHHQAQIREALGVDLLYEPKLFAPVLETFVRVLPHTFRDSDASEGTTVRLRITGAAGGEWWLARSGDRWAFSPGLVRDPDAGATLDQDTAWRLFTKGLSPATAEDLSELDGEIRLARQVLQMVSIIA